MLHFSRFQIVVIAGICLLSLVFAVPSFISKETVAAWPDFLPKRQMPLGLDLQGGAHLLLAMDTDELRTDWLQGIRDDARRQLRDAKIFATGVGITGGAVQIRLTNAGDSEAAVRELRKLAQPLGSAMLGTAGGDIEVTPAAGGVITVAPTPAGVAARITNATGAAIETINRRVNALGTAESTVVRQGQDRILVQFPGLQDTKQLKELIGETARLSFHDVHPQVTAEAGLARAPPGYKVYPSGEGDGLNYLLRETPVVHGDDLTDAQPGFDQRTNEPIISFRFNQSGARKFGSFTRDNVGRPFAIVLDNKVLSAPVIREPILGGSGQISGSFTVESANMLAVQLRSGALPAKLTIIEERSVGPSLGADSIDAGKIATLIGFVGVSAFMIAGYGLFGLFAIIALVVNLAIIIAALSLLGATLTLPGIAGIVLTMGMSVDANVLINERIRDELSIGKTPIAALDAGFARAYGTILDTNVTGLVVGIIMFWLGSGPIRGFAVTLSIGIIASAFTATTVTRALIAAWVRRTRPKAIPI